MRIQLDHVSKGSGGEALPATRVAFETGAATLARAETQQRPTVLALIASGRMRADSGTVTINGEVDAALMRRRIALVDAPDVSEPAGGISVRGITSEELMFAGRRSDPLAARRMLGELGLSEFSRTNIENLPPAHRVRLLCELALLRDGVEGLVIVSPDRHGGDPNDWWSYARALAARGIAVLVIAGDASAAAIAASTLVERMNQTGDDEDPNRDDTDETPDVISVVERLSEELS